MQSPYPANHPFVHMVPSDTPENIYYADLFHINNHNWMIQGYGKSNAAIIASDRKAEAMYATDAVAIIRDGDTLWGRFDPGALTTNNSELHALHKIDVIAYCLNQQDTIKAFTPRNGVLEIVEADLALLSSLCAVYGYPAYMGKHFFAEHEFDYFANPLRMMKRFVELTEGSVGTKFLIVPYMPTIEEKAALYRSFKI